MALKSYKLATINDVAAKAGVSKKTVSRVINELPLVRGETRTRVLKAIKALRYVPNLQARSLASNRSYLLGFIYDNPNADFVSDLQSGVLAKCQRHGYELVVRQCRMDDPYLAHDIAGLAERTKLDGIVILPPLSENDALARALRDVNCPFVRIGAVALDEAGSYINCEDRHAAEQMATHLVQLGHKRIAFIRGPRGFKSASERAKGFRAGLKKAGLVLDSGFTVQGKYTYKSGLECGRLLLERRSPPTAIFASNDQMAQGVLRVANELGLSVPNDVAIAGFDDGAVAIRSWPPLTTIRQPVESIGELAAIKLIHSTADPTPDNVSPELVVRASTAGF